MGNLDDLPFKLKAFGSHFFEARRMDDGKLHSFLAAFFKHSRNQGVLDRNIHQIYLIRDIGYRRIGSETFNEIRFRVYGVNRTFEIVINQVCHHYVANAQRIIGSSDDRY